MQCILINNSRSSLAHKTVKAFYVIAYANKTPVKCCCIEVYRYWKDSLTLIRLDALIEFSCKRRFPFFLRACMPSRTSRPLKCRFQVRALYASELRCCSSFLIWTNDGVRHECPLKYFFSLFNSQGERLWIINDVSRTRSTPAHLATVHCVRESINQRSCV